MAIAESRNDASAQRFERVQELQTRLDAMPSSPVKALAEELVSSVVGLYGEALERIMVALGAEGAPLADDPYVATVLLVHDLHPVALGDRVAAALDSVRPYMESHGGNVELLSLAGGVARIRLRGSCRDCTASSVTLELAIKQALEQHAPDLEELVVEELSQLPMQPPPAGGCAT